MKKQLSALQAEGTALIEKQLIEKQPVNRFTFSPTLKYNTIVLSESNARATNSTSVSYAVALLEPSLPMSTVSKISLKINKLQWSAIGVCYKDVVEGPNYQINSNILH